MSDYNHKDIETKWQKEWEKTQLYKTSEDSTKENYYVLDMFPYPSGAGLHVGHPKGYIATDILARYKTMQGYNVLHPMGWDAFGLPAENYALKNKVHPRKAVEENIARFKSQLSQIGFTYDWDREINTTDPDYYKWTQWIFVQLFKKGLAYESNEPINWCPECKTGLANEDLEGGKCERCGSIVEQKPLRQWVLKIREYADRLLDDLEGLDWPHSIKESQRNWIGRSEGSEIEFQIKGSSENIKVFTTRPDTLFGATYMVLAPEHPLIHEFEENIENLSDVKAYIEEARKKDEIERTSLTKEKTGVELKGITAINPANNEEIPVWIADYVLWGYGTGAIMAVPAHDERDHAFAEKYDIPIKQVVAPMFKPTEGKDAVRQDKPVKRRMNVHCIVKHHKEDKILCLDWGKYEWRSFIIGGVEDGEDPVEAALREIEEETGYTNVRFVGEAGPEIHGEYYAEHKGFNRYAVEKGLYFELIDETQKDISEEEAEKHSVVWVERQEVANFLNLENILLRWELFNEGGVFAGEGLIINSEEFDEISTEEAREAITRHVGGEMKVGYKLRDWVFSRQRYWGEPIPIIHCEKCGPVAVPESELPVTLPDVEHYEPTGTGESPLAAIDEWVHTTCPECGGAGKRETNTMPQWAGSSWYYLRYIDSNNSDALIEKQKDEAWSPVDMYVGGAEHATRHLIYARFWHKFLYDIGVVNYTEPFTRLQHVGLIQAEDGRKMSKRWGNVINPDDIVERLGADTLRTYEMFMGPFDGAVAWSTDGAVGVRRFIEKVWRIGTGDFVETTDADVQSVLHRTIHKVGSDIEKFRFNTAVSQMMICATAFEKQGVSKKDFLTFLYVLAPFAPHVTEELWYMLGETNSIHTQAWPDYDENLLIDEEVTIAVQVNGKVRGEFTIEKGSEEETLKEKAIKLESVKKWLEDGEPKRIIVIPDRLVNIVV